AMVEHRIGVLFAMAVKLDSAKAALGRAITEDLSYLAAHVELVKLAMAIGAKMEGAVHSHTRKALEAGATPREIRHLVLLGLTTLGFPSTIAALSWVEDVLKKARPRKRGKKSR
ncbi:MAG: carboxymuconolactone decarboxylase family protein, partial [Candidatus Binatota bacterium]